MAKQTQLYLEESSYVVIVSRLKNREEMVPHTSVLSFWRLDQNSKSSFKFSHLPSLLLHQKLIGWNGYRGLASVSARTQDQDLIWGQRPNITNDGTSFPHCTRLGQVPWAPRSPSLISTGNLLSPSHRVKSQWWAWILGSIQTHLMKCQHWVWIFDFRSRRDKWVGEFSVVPNYLTHIQPSISFLFCFVSFTSMCTRDLLGSGGMWWWWGIYPAFQESEGQIPFLLPHFFKSFPHLPFLFPLLFPPQGFPFFCSFVCECVGGVWGARGTDLSGTGHCSSASALLTSLNLVSSLVEISLPLRSADTLYQFFFFKTHCSFLPGGTSSTFAVFLLL